MAAAAESASSSSSPAHQCCYLSCKLCSNERVCCAAATCTFKRQGLLFICEVMQFWQCEICLAARNTATRAQWSTAGNGSAAGLKTLPEDGTRSLEIEPSSLSVENHRPHLKTACAPDSFSVTTTCMTSRSQSKPGLRSVWQQALSSDCSSVDQWYQHPPGCSVEVRYCMLHLRHADDGLNGKTEQHTIPDTATTLAGKHDDNFL